MKTVSCKQIGGACEKEFSVESFDELVEASKLHAMEMMLQQDEPHLKAIEAMQDTLSDPEKMKTWLDEKRAEFEAIPES